MPNLDDALTKAKAVGTTTLVDPYLSDGRTAVMVQFPGGYVAEIHSRK